LGVRNLRFEEFKKEVEDLEKIAEGWRGVVYRGRWKGKDIAIKVAKSSDVIKAIQKEAEILEKLKGIENFPQIILSGEDFFAYHFIEGVPFRKAGLNPEEEKEVLKKLLEIAYLLDTLGIKRDEFANVGKNVLIDKNREVYVLDFERGSFAKRPSNLTQFMQLLVRKGYLDREEAIRLGKKYMKEREEVFEELLSKLK